MRGLKQELTGAERFAVADHVVRQLTERGDPLAPEEVSEACQRADDVKALRVWAIWPGLQPIRAHTTYAAKEPAGTNF